MENGFIQEGETAKESFIPRLAGKVSDREITLLLLLGLDILLADNYNRIRIILKKRTAYDEIRKTNL